MRARSSKFGNHRTTVDGITFDSKREAARYCELRLLERTGKVRDLQRQVEYRLEVNGALVCKYRADFVYEEPEFGTASTKREGHPPQPQWIKRVEDVKGFRTPEYKIKAKLMLACHNVVVRET